MWLQIQVIKVGSLNLDAKIIQIIECLNCNYSYRESWEYRCGGHTVEPNILS